MPEGPVLVTGAAGFIGSHLVEALLATGRRVVGVDNFDPFYDPAAKGRNVQAALGSPGGRGYEFVEADIREPEAIAAVFDRVRPEGVVHLAAKAGVRPSIADPVGYARTNLLGTAAVLEEARRAGCSRFLFASSSSVYGNNRKVPFSETDDVSEPISPYASTKRSGELLCYTHWRLTGMPAACLRFFTVFGPRQRPDLAISLFMRRIAAGEPITMFGDGSSSRDYTYIDDIVAGLLAAYERVPRFGYRVWNLGGSRPVALADMIRTIARVAGREPVIERAPEQPGDVERTFADVARSAAELGFKATTPFVKGVEAQWSWFRSQPGG